MIVPEEMEKFFYEIASKEMIVAWKHTSFFDVCTFVQRDVLEKPYTTEFKSWFRNLFDDPSAPWVQELVDKSVQSMVQKITNTKLKAIRVYHEAQELKGGVKFRDQRRVEAGIQLKKMKSDMST